MSAGVLTSLYTPFTCESRIIKSTSWASARLPLDMSHRGLRGMQAIPTSCRIASTDDNPNMNRHPPAPRETKTAGGMYPCLPENFLTWPEASYVVLFDMMILRPKSAGQARSSTIAGEINSPRQLRGTRYFVLQAVHVASSKKMDGSALPVDLVRKPHLQYTRLIASNHWLNHQQQILLP